MGNYAEVADIQAEFKNVTYSTSTTPTQNQVDEFITQAEAVLDGGVSTVYTVPVTGTIAKSIMKTMTILLVKARILERTLVKSGSEADQGGKSLPQQLREQVLDPDNGMLPKIQKKEILLYGASELSGGSIESYNYENAVEPIFEKETDQW